MATERVEPGVRRSLAGTALTAGCAAAALLLLVLLPACGGGGPDEIPDRLMSLNIQGMLASQVVEFAAGVGGFPIEFTEGALTRAEKKTVTLQVDDAHWLEEVLAPVVENAGLEWEWVERDERWVIRIRLPEER